MLHFYFSLGMPILVGAVSKLLPSLWLKPSTLSFFYFFAQFVFFFDAVLLLLPHRDLLRCPPPQQLVFPDTVPALRRLPGYPLAVYAQTGT